MTTTANNGDVPSTLTSDPTLALVPPGKCQFGEEFSTVQMLKRWDISATTSVLRFGLPDSSQPLNLSTCACILAKADLPVADSKDNEDKKNGVEEVIRPYTPISTNADSGFFDLMIKNYGEHGRMSTYLCSLNPGAKVDFKHIPFNVKIQAPFPYKRVGMIVGGTGITPMIQALHAILGDATSSIQVDILYGSRVSSDILGKELLDAWTKSHGGDDDKDSNGPGRLSVTHVLSHEPTDSSWKGERGYIDAKLIEKHLPPPDDKESIIFICGPPPMYDALCGPRVEKNLSGLLKEMGYSDNQVYKF